MSDKQNNASNSNIKIRISNDEKLQSSEDFADNVGEAEIYSNYDKPDYARIRFQNMDHMKGSKRLSELAQAGNELEVFMWPAIDKFDEDKHRVFKGSILINNPTFVAPHTVEIHGMNKLHDMMRDTKFCAFQKSEHKKIIRDLAGEKLKVDFGKDDNIELSHKHLHQSGKNDYEILSELAKLAGRRFWVDLKNETLHYEKYDKGQTPVCKLILHPTTDPDSTKTIPEFTMERFEVRSSAVGVKHHVKVIGWDPDKQEKVIGEAKEEESQLADKLAGSAKGDKPILTISWPGSDKKHAQSLADSILQSLNMNYTAGTCLTGGNPLIRLGTTIDIDVKDERFNGKYYVSSVHHKYSNSPGGSQLGGGGTFKTEVQVQRDADMAKEKPKQTSA